MDNVIEHNYNISAFIYSQLTAKEKEELDKYMEAIHCTYTIVE